MSSIFYYFILLLIVPPTKKPPCNYSSCRATWLIQSVFSASLPYSQNQEAQIRTFADQALTDPNRQDNDHDRTDTLLLLLQLYLDALQGALDDIIHVVVLILR